MNKGKVGGENSKWLIVINGQKFGLRTSSLIFQQIKKSRNVIPTSFNEQELFQLCEE